MLMWPAFTRKIMEMSTDPDAFYVFKVLSYKNTICIFRCEYPSIKLLTALQYRSRATDSHITHLNVIGIKIDIKLLTSFLWQAFKEASRSSS